MGTVRPGALNEREDDSTAGISDRAENLKVVAGVVHGCLPAPNVPQAPPDQHLNHKQRKAAQKAARAARKGEP